MTFHFFTLGLGSHHQHRHEQDGGWVQGGSGNRVILKTLGGNGKCNGKTHDITQKKGRQRDGG